MRLAYILTFACPDQIGIVHAVTGFLAQRGGNISEAAQFTDPFTQRFFMRVRFDLPQAQADAVSAQFEPLAQSLQLAWNLWPAAQKMRTILMVSKLGHCLNDLLYRYRSGLIPLDICAVVSNHRDYYQLAAQSDIPFYHIPVTAETKPQAEAQLMALVEKEKAELVVLARYMQVLSDTMCTALSGRAINIHHSFCQASKARALTIRRMTGVSN
jgi:formyltetrahydrofolate deformylase